MWIKKALVHYDISLDLVNGLYHIVLPTWWMHYANTTDTINKTETERGKTNIVRSIHRLIVWIKKALVHYDISLDLVNGLYYIVLPTWWMHYANTTDTINKTETERGKTNIVRSIHRLIVWIKKALVHYDISLDLVNGLYHLVLPTCWMHFVYMADTVNKPKTERGRKQTLWKLNIVWLVV